MKSVGISTALHAAVLTWGLWSLGSPEPLEMGGEALPVTLISDLSEATQGDEKAPEAPISAPKPTQRPETVPTDAQNVGDNKVDLPTPPTPKQAPQESIKTAAAEAPPPPPPAATPTPPEPTPAPVPEPTPAPPEVAEAKPEEPTPPEPPTEIDELAELLAEKPPEVPAPPRNVPTPQAKPKPPEPVKVAEKPPEPKPEPVKEAVKTPEKTKTPDKAKSTEKTKETKTADSQKSDEKTFEDTVAALLNKQDSAGGGAKRSTQTASLGAQKATGGSLSQNEMDALRGQVEKCWNPPAGNADAGNFVVKISMQLSPSGEIEGMPQILDGGSGSTAQRAAGEAAVRAVRRCAPYNLPAEKYDTWSKVTFNFDPSQMF
ncbi:cell envelope integrity protein TolA [Aureimonas sp. AU12]|uniref:cell envelope integrity protein TolA n=1 Tax=Aureimonas sp. AU12 TaxID=1638161 RepID=UPI000785D05D|nr:cell envelope integrity protein TolA [Aureimonas sp. AU12]